MTKKAKPKSGRGIVRPGEVDTLQLTRQDDESDGSVLARVLLDPLTRHAHLAGSFASRAFGDNGRPSIAETSAVLGEEVAKAEDGDTKLASRILASQAVSLDALFTEMARRSGDSMIKYPEAMDRYMRLALKAQSACRATLEALAKLHQPREQTVRHVHINEGGQAIVTEQFHHHTGGKENENEFKQSHATCAARKCATLLCPDALGNAVSIACCERTEAVPNARRDQSRPPAGQQKRLEARGEVSRDIAVKG